MMMTNTLDKETIESLAIKCGAMIEEFTGNDNKKHKQICFECGTDELQAFANELTKPQEPTAWGVFNEVENSYEFIANWREAGNEHINDMPTSEISKMRLVPLFKAPPNYEALVKENERFCEDAERLELLEDCIHSINMWRKAYPLTAFPEPDLKKSRELLKAGGQTLDAVSASCFRHVLEGVGAIIDKALAKDNHD